MDVNSVPDGVPMRNWLAAIGLTWHAHLRIRDKWAFRVQSMAEWKPAGNRRDTRNIFPLLELALDELSAINNSKGYGNLIDALHAANLP